MGLLGSFPPQHHLENPCIQMLAWGASREASGRSFITQENLFLSCYIKYISLVLWWFVFHSHPTFSLQMLEYDTITKIIVFFFLQH